MKRLVFGIAVVGLIVVLAPALLNASEIDRAMLQDDASAHLALKDLRAQVGALPLAIEPSQIQLVDHCYRRSYRGYGGGYHGSRYASPYDFAPRRGSYYRGGHYGSGYHHHYHAPRSSYYRGRSYGAYPRSGFGLYIGF